MASDTHSESKLMLQKNQDMIEKSRHAMASLRSSNPTIRVAASIYDSDNNTARIYSPDIASVIAPSELEFEFDNMIINSQAYRRVFIQA